MTPYHMAALTNWRVSAGDSLTVFDGNQCKIVSVLTGGISGRTLTEGEATARMISAAPDMLEALQGAMDILSRAESNASGNPEFDYVGPRVRACRAALAKVAA